MTTGLHVVTFDFSTALRSICDAAARVRFLCITAILLVSPLFGSALAQQAEEEESYESLWARGEYAQALALLEDTIENARGYVQTSDRRDLAWLRFENGQLDKAIEKMEEVCNDNREPAYCVELALFYKYVGRNDDFERMLRLAESRYGSGRNWQYYRRNENAVAMARVYELAKLNPKDIMAQIYEPLSENDRDPRLAVVHLGAGGLAYRKGNYDVAAKRFDAALEEKPKPQQLQEALVGLAECYWKSHDGRLDPMLQRILDLNPNNPRARAIQVELLLDRAKGKEALKLIGEALAINPKSLRFLALKSAAHFVEADAEAMARTQLVGSAINQVSSEILRTTGRIASRQYRFAEGAAFQEKALELDPDDYEARGYYTQDLLRLGKEVEGRAELEWAFKEDPYNVQLFNLISLMDTLETFTTIERGAFVLRLPAHEADLLAEDALGLLDQAIETFEAKYAIDLTKPVLIEMFDKHDDFMVRSVGLPGNAGHLGICFGQLVTMDSPSARPRGSWNWRSVLWHEFMHVITLQKTNNLMPRWLSEGISVYEEHQYSPAWRSKLDPDFRVILATEDALRVRDLTNFFLEPKSPNHLMFGYFAAGEFVEYYTAAFGMTAMNTALDAIGEGAEAVRALAEASGEPPRELDRGYQDHLAERVKPFDNLPQVELPEGHLASGPGLVEKLMERIQDTPSPEDAPFAVAMRKAQEALTQESWDEAEAALKEAHELFPDLLGEQAPLFLLAELYRHTKRAEALTETLLEIFGSSPAELAASEELIEIYSANGKWNEVARIADWALGIDPYEKGFHEAYIEGLLNSAREQEALRPLNVLAHLDSAHAIDHRLHRARIYRDLGETAPARAEVVRVLENVPNFWDAQALLLELIDPVGEAGGSEPNLNPEAPVEQDQEGSGGEASLPDFK